MAGDEKLQTQTDRWRLLFQRGKTPARSRSTQSHLLEPQRLLRDLTQVLRLDVLVRHALSSADEAHLDSRGRRNHGRLVLRPGLAGDRLPPPPVSKEGAGGRNSLSLA